MKTPDEIKQGQKLCLLGTACGRCPYYNVGHGVAFARKTRRFRINELERVLENGSYALFDKLWGCCCSYYRDFFCAWISCIIYRLKRKETDDRQCLTSQPYGTNCTPSMTDG